VYFLHFLKTFRIQKVQKSLDDALPLGDVRKLEVFLFLVDEDLGLERRSANEVAFKFG